MLYTNIEGFQPTIVETRNMKWEMLAFCVLLLGCAHENRTSTISDSNESYAREALLLVFKGKRDEVERGLLIGRMVSLGNEIEDNNWHGKTAAFFGSSTQTGGNGSVVIFGGVLVRMTFYPDPNAWIRPESIAWTACVLGEIISIDWDDRTILLRVRPEDWQLYDRT